MYSFPHTHYENSDLKEVLRICQQAFDEYNKFNDRLTEYENTIEPLIANKVAEEVSKEYSNIVEALEEIKLITEKNQKSIEAKLQDEVNSRAIAVDELKEEMSYMHSELTAEDNKIKSKIDNVIHSMEKMLIDFDLRISEIKKLNSDEIAEAKKDLLENIQPEIDETKKDIEELRSLITETIGVVYNPMTGEMESVNNALGKLYYALISPHVANVAQHDSDAPTAEQIDNSLAEIWRASVDDEMYKRKELINPFTGKQQSLQGILSMMANSLLTLSNSKIEELGVSYGTPENLGMTYKEGNENLLWYEVDGEYNIGPWFNGEYAYIYRITKTIEGDGIGYCTIEIPEDVGYIIDASAIVKGVETTFNVTHWIRNGKNGNIDFFYNDDEDIALLTITANIIYTKKED